MKIKNILVNAFLIILFVPLLGCAGFFIGEENISKPVDLPKDPKIIKLEEIWHKKIGNGTGSKSLTLRPVVVSNKVFVVSSNGYLAALNLDDGSIIWEKNIGRSISSGVSADKNLVVVASDDGLLMAFSSTDGSDGWTYQMSTEVVSPVSIISGLVIPRAIDGQVFAIDARSGTPIWKQYIDVADLSIRGNSRAVLIDGAALFSTSKGYLTALSIKDGRKIFSIPLVAGKGLTNVSQISDLLATPIAKGSTLFLSAYRNKTLAINLRSGSMLWDSPYATSLDLFADDNSIYLVDKNSLIRALDITDGKLVWTSKILEGRHLSPISGDDKGNWISVIDKQGMLSFFDRKKGNYLGRIKVGKLRSFVTPTLTSEGVLTYTSDGQLTLTSFKRY